MFTYGDKLQQAIDTINNHLKRGANIYLWDANNPDENAVSLDLDDNSDLQFAVFEIDWKEVTECTHTTN